MGEFAPARWGGSGKKSVKAVPTHAAPAVPAEAAVEPEPVVEETPRATDAAEALAAEHGIDLAAITGSGLDGRITKEDVAALIPAEPEPIPVEPTPEPTGEATAHDPVSDDG